MQVKAVTKYARISAFKARNTTRVIQGMGALPALELLTFQPQKAARLVAKTLKSAIANAEENSALDPETLVVKEAVVGEGPTFKRFQPKARGSAGAIRKRTSHIRIILEEREEEEEKVEKKPKAKAKKGESAKKKAPAKKAAAKATKASAKEEKTDK